MSNNEVTVPAKEPEHALKTPTGQRMDEESFARIQATPHTAKPDLGNKKSDESRKDVAQAMNSEMFVFAITEFLKHYGPAPDTEITPETTAECKDYLLELKVLQKSTDGNVDVWTWTKFQKTPAKSKKKEIDAFDPLADIVNGIWKYADENDKKKNNFTFKMVPQNHIESSISGANHMMDACIMEVSYRDMVSNNKVVMPFEMKNDWIEKDQIEVREQVVGDSHHILCDDPRRMFIYAGTMEDDRFSVWYFSRTHSVKALAFKWMSGEGIDMFIKVMLAFAYATPKDLGFDPHVHRAPLVKSEDGQRWIYEFEVDENFTTVEGGANPDGKRAAPVEARPTRALHTSKPAPGKKKIFFRTIRARTPMRPICISGRTTRIWEVVEVASLRDHLPVEGAVPVILKDVWLDAESWTEGENQEAVFRAVDKFVADGLKAHPGEDGMMRFMNAEPRFQHFNDRTKKRLASLLTDQKYKGLFLTKILEWQGERTKERNPDACRPEKPLFALASTDGKPGIASLAAGPCPSTQVIPATRITSAIPQRPAVVAQRRYAQKKQVRFVYKEVCTEIHNVGTFGEMMDITRQALDALQILYCAGWVHRDISTGNIMAVPVKDATGNAMSWKIKLADLEFSQVFGHSTHRSDPRTGTPYFMPIEVMKGQYLANGFLTVEANMTADLSRLNIVRTVPPNPQNLAANFELAPGHPDYVHYSKFTREAAHCFDGTLPELRVHEDIPYDHVKHNYQHDLESLWWIMLYFITACAGWDASEDFSKQVFLHNLDAGQRKDTLRDTLSATLRPVLHETLYVTFLLPMDHLRRHLYQQYVQRAICGNMDIDSAYSFIHGQFAEQLDLILDENIKNWQALRIVLKDGKGKPIGESCSDLPFGSTKRGREEDADKKPAVGKPPKKVRTRK